MSAGGAPILTLEPLLDAVREGVEGSGWPLSGLQKTTSHEFAGRWDGESTRSAYLFFHQARWGEEVAVEAFLDETSRGLQGNVSLVLDGPELGRVGDAADALAGAAAASARVALAHRPSVALKLRMEAPGAAVEAATTELRIKVRIPSAAVRDGAGAVGGWVTEVVRCFEALLLEPELARYRDGR